MKLSEKAQTSLRKQLNEQRRWMTSCGTTRSGYILHYDSREQGNAIYEADLAALHRIEKALGLR
jgi:hypothetical protein